MCLWGLQVGSVGQHGQSLSALLQASLLYLCVSFIFAGYLKNMSWKIPRLLKGGFGINKTLIIQWISLQYWVKAEWKSVLWCKKSVLRGRKFGVHEWFIPQSCEFSIYNCTKALLLYILLWFMCTFQPRSFIFCICIVLLSCAPLFLLLAACKDHRKALEVSQHSEEMGLILGVCAGGLVVLILLLGAVIIIIKKG